MADACFQHVVPLLHQMAVQMARIMAVYTIGLGLGMDGAHALAGV